MLEKSYRRSDEMKALPPIMIGVPICQSAEKYLSQFLEGIEKLNYPRFELVFSDNSGSDTFREKLRQVPNATVLEREPTDNANENILSSMVQLRGHFMDKGYLNSLLILESDIVPQPDTLNVLVNEDKEIIGCPYYLSKDMMMINLFEPWGEPKSIIPEDYIRFYQSLPLMRVWNCGFGCTLIKRHILENYEFHLKKTDWRCVDSVFSEDMCERKIPVYCKTNHLVRHLRVEEVE